MRTHIIYSVIFRVSLNLGEPNPVCYSQGFLCLRCFSSALSPYLLKGQSRAEALRLLRSMDPACDHPSLPISNALNIYNSNPSYLDPLAGCLEEPHEPKLLKSQPPIFGDTFFPVYHTCLHIKCVGPNFKV